MPFPQSLARFNRRVTNPIARLVAGRVPPLAILEHRGRRSGTTYRTPVVVFRSDGADGADGYVVALTYGPETDWVRNVLAAGGCTLVTDGRRIALTDPQLMSDHARARMLAPIRLALRLLRVSSYLDLRRAT